MVPCPHCGTEFEPRRGQVYDRAACRKAAFKRTDHGKADHKATAHRARAYQNAHGATEFIAVDGEGWTDALGVHRYAMLSVGDDTLWEPNGEGLTAEAIFEFLWEQFEAHPTATFIGFYLGYDFSQWFRGLPENRARRLLTRAGIAGRRTAHGRPVEVEWDGWGVDCLGDKRVRLTRYPTGARVKHTEREKAYKWLYVCDTGPFFQASFLSVINPKNWPEGVSVATPEEYATILEGKSKRADEYTRETWLAAREELTRYNTAENRVLARIMGRYEEGMKELGITLDRTNWYGPGAAVKSWLKSRGMPKRDVVEEMVPGWVLDMAQKSYYGGHFQVMAHGIVPGPSYEYDVNSAYPAAMAISPCWLHAGYREVDWETEGIPPLALLDVTTHGSDPVMAAFPHRERTGRIHFPRWTRGVRWSFELAAGIAAGLVDEVTIHRVVGIEVHGAARQTPGAAYSPDHVRGVAQSHPESWAHGVLVVDGDGGGARRLRACECRGCQPRRKETQGPSTPGDVRGDGGSDPPRSGPHALLRQPTLCEPSTSNPGHSVRESGRHDSEGSALLRSGPQRSLVGTNAAPCLLNTSELQCDALTRGIPELYVFRKARHKNSPEGKAAKLVLNSAYGVQAQSIGAPQYSNALAASFITAWCRTAILTAIGSHPTGTADLLMIATDGVYFRTPHPTLDIDAGRLGAWDEASKMNLTIVMPGVHYSDAGREAVATGDYAKLRSRGVPAESMAKAIATLDSAFGELRERPWDPTAWPVLPIVVRFSVTSPKLALHRNKWDLAGTVSRDIERTMGTSPATKRIGPSDSILSLDVPYLDEWGVVRTYPYDQGEVLLSAPYDESFGRAFEEARETGEDWGFSPDGNAMSEALSALRGD